MREVTTARRSARIKKGWGDTGSYLILHHSEELGGFWLNSLLIYACVRVPVFNFLLNINVRNQVIIFFCLHDTSKFFSLFFNFCRFF